MCDVGVNTHTNCILYSNLTVEMRAVNVPHVAGNDTLITTSDED